RLYEIIPYVGFGNEHRVLVQGRAVEERDIDAASPDDGIIQNLVNTVRRIDRHPLAQARIAVHFGGATQEIVADDEGFFRAWVERPLSSEAASGWEEGRVRLLAPLRADQPDVRATFRARVPSTRASFGVISDLDDTVIQSRIANLLQAVRTISLGNA